METSLCLDDSSVDTAKQSKPAVKLHHVGSGASVVLDPEAGVEAESRKLPSSHYKGVVPQPNGRWGAQIYEKHQRVWLGTFNKQSQAARAYDVAVQRFRGRYAVTNFKPFSDVDDDGADELEFLKSHSKTEIVDMLRKHTYEEELQQSKRISVSDVKKKSMNAATTVSCCVDKEHLFDKAVTPSDVGKLNRLVIPKQHAEKHFPLHPKQFFCGNVGVGDSSECKGVLLNFEDPRGKVWKFRYSYWNSSQSYVLTKGWSRFVKEKGLNAGDVISFHRSMGSDKQLFIDWKVKCATTSVVSSSVGQVFRLFGVDIKTTDENVKRSREELMCPKDVLLSKKRCVEAL